VRAGACSGGLTPARPRAGGDHRITGDEAKELFARSSLPKTALKKVWALSDTQHRGYLDIHAFCRAMDLMALAQLGKARCWRGRGGRCVASAKRPAAVAAHTAAL